MYNRRGNHSGRTGNHLRKVLSEHELARIASPTSRTGEVNWKLKEIMKTAEISKSISFHCSRHTFATCGRSLGIPIDIISEILGHNDLITTKIYTKYEDEMKIQEMQKWNIAF